MAMNARWICTTVGLLIIASGERNVVTASSTEYHLKKTLFAEYDHTVRPVKNHTDAVDVKLDVVLSQIISLEEKLQVLFANIWIRLKWHDEHLTWDPTEWQNLESINNEKQSVWVPDIQIVNYANERPIENEHFQVKVDYRGLSQWLYQAIVKSTCNVDVQYFPYDTQLCSIIFSSWSYQVPMLNLLNAKETGDISEFVRNGEWHLIGMPAKRNLSFSKCCPDPFSMITYDIIMERRPLYYVYNLMVPCLCLLGTAMTGFLLPPESGEKLSLGVTILLSLTVFLLLVAEITPTQSEVIPLLGQFFGISIMLQTFSTAMNVVVINVHCRGGHNVDVPGWLRVFAFGFLAKIFCRPKEVKEQLHYVNSKVDKTRNRTKNLQFEDDLNGENAEFVSVGVSFGNHDLSSMDKNTPISLKPEGASNILSLHRTVLRIEKKLANYIRDIERQELHQTEWRLIAVLLDRLLLVLFILVVLCVLCLFLLKPPPDMRTPR